MKTYIALFRGINVGGHNVLPMKEMVTLLENLDSYGVKTYIQSGNAVFRNNAEDSNKLSNRISGIVQENYGFEPRVLLLNLDELDDVIVLNPFPRAVVKPKTLHIYFLDSVPKNPDLDLLESIKKNNEQYKLINKLFYLHAPDGIGRSKLATRIEKSLGVSVTARNWRSVCKILDMAKQCDRQHPTKI